MVEPFDSFLQVVENYAMYVRSSTCNKTKMHAKKTMQRHLSGPSRQALRDVFTTIIVTVYYVHSTNYKTLEKVVPPNRLLSNNWLLVSYGKSYLLAGMSFTSVPRDAYFIYLFNLHTASSEYIMH